jgi:hypothetical protein
VLICERKILSKKKQVINFTGGKHCSIRLSSFGGKQRVGKRFLRGRREKVRDL